MFKPLTLTGHYRKPLVTAHVSVTRTWTTTPRNSSTQTEARYSQEVNFTVSLTAALLICKAARVHRPFCGPSCSLCSQHVLDCTCAASFAGIFVYSSGHLYSVIPLNWPFGGESLPLCSQVESKAICILAHFSKGTVFLRDGIPYLKDQVHVLLHLVSLKCCSSLLFP